MSPLNHFSAAAPWYEKFIRSHRKEELVKALDVKSEHRLLDAAGGTGRVSRLFASECRGVVIVDENWQMLQQAAAVPGLFLIQASTERLPFVEGAFERVMMVDAFHHVTSQADTVSEMVRVTAAGGRIVIEEGNITKMGVKVIALLERLIGMRSQFQTPETIRQMLTRRNCKVNVVLNEAYAWIQADKPDTA